MAEQWNILFFRLMIEATERWFRRSFGLLATLTNEKSGVLS
jgi:hypothetical protein